MRVYVASKWENTAAVREAFAALRAVGHTIAHDWTVATGNTPAELVDCAWDDVWGVRSAEALLLINHVGGAGMFTELGIAMAGLLRIIVIDGFKPGLPANIFFHLPCVEHARDLADACRLLGERRP